MPARYHPVAPSIWDRAMRELSGPAMVVRFYVMTCPTRVSEGLFQLPLGHLIHDTGLQPEHVDQALSDLESAALVLYDHDAEVVLDRTALKHNPLRNGLNKKTGEVKPDNRILSAVKLFEQVPDTPLKLEFFRLAFEYSPDLAQPLGERFPSLTFATGPHLEDTPFEAPSKPLASPSEGASREEASREELSREGGGEGVVPACGHCLKDLSRVIGGEVDLKDDLPWCGWCEVGEAA
jgi:hypothetical protein